MYLQTCEATHAKGEQSAEVLDLRMACLNDNLEQVRALTDALVTAEITVLSRAVAAAQDLTPVSRCADVALLRSAVPLPRHERTLHEVQRLQRSLAEVQTLIDLGDTGKGRKRLKALRPEVEAIGYKPLLAQLLTLLGYAEAALDDDPSQSESTLREAMIAAESSRDDLAAAKVATHLVYVVGHRLDRQQDAEFWAGLAHAILDRVGGDQAKVRAWVLGNQAAAKLRTGDFEAARVLTEKSMLLTEQSLGKEHPGVAMSLGNLAYVLAAGGHPDEALVAADRAVEIFLEHSDPEAFSLAFVYSNQGDALSALGRYADAEKAYDNALKIHRKNVGAMNPELAFALHGLAAMKLNQGAAVTAVRFFEDALRIRQQPHADPLLAADTAFGLARALWSSGGDRTKARSLAATALSAYQDGRTTDRQRAVETWLAANRAVSSSAHEGTLNYVFRAVILRVAL